MQTILVKTWHLILICAVCSAAACANAGESSNPAQELKIEAKRGDVSVSVRLKSARFDPKKHKIEKRNGFAYVDNHRVIGTDGSVPYFSELSGMEILWNGKSVPVVRDAYAPIYNAHLSAGLVDVAIDEKGELVLIALTCGDATREWVWLTIGKNGEWHRFTKSEGDD